MPTSGPGSSTGRRFRAAGAADAGFTLIELMVVVAIIALGAALVTLAIRDPAETRLENEAARLAALLETARVEARAGGFSVAWLPTADSQGAPGFRFVGLPSTFSLPSRWLDDRVGAQVVGAPGLVLGPEAILPPQRVVLTLDERRLEVATDGLSAFAVVAAPGTAQ